MNNIDMLFGASPREIVLNFVFGIALGFIVLYSSLVLIELTRQKLIRDTLLSRLIMGIICCFVVGIPMMLLNVPCRILSFLLAVSCVVSFVDVNWFRPYVRSEVRHYAMFVYKDAMTPENVLNNIKTARNRYCLKEWLLYGWKLPNGDYVCSDTNRFREDLQNVLSQCSKNGLEEWQIQTVYECGYKFCD